jgi:hypothetical protein
MTTKLLYSVLIYFVISVPSFLGLILCTYEAYTHCEFPRLRRNWSRINKSYTTIQTLMLSFAQFVSLLNSKPNEILILQWLEVFAYYKVGSDSYKREK